ncbi:uncharacterized protein LOC111261494 [Varroa jacobsoni]|uniref:Uncharacterized protein n=1 Tax=Varroa destructor TaxID=109461 RepID=A0A7M7IZA3_VARDE|nr:uncharacterized protein LOC111242996 [Varroa destructor]XP_022690765.1 uncharacterized protein LOC111261494 [Varroa jacobsoni]
MWNRTNTYRVELLAQVSTGVNSPHMSEQECIALAVRYARKTHEGPLHYLVVEGSSGSNGLCIKTRAEPFGATGSVRAPVVSHGQLMRALHCKEESRVVVLVFLDVFEGDIYLTSDDEVRNVLVWRTATTEEAVQLSSLSSVSTDFRKTALQAANEKQHLLEKNNARNKKLVKDCKNHNVLSAQSLSSKTNSRLLVSRRDIYDVGLELQRSQNGKICPMVPPPVPDKPLSVVMLFNQKKASLSKAAGKGSKTVKNSGQHILSLAPVPQDLIAYQYRSEVLASDVPKIVAETKKKGNKLKRKPAMVMRQQLAEHVHGTTRIAGPVVPLPQWFSWMAIPSWIARPIFYQDFYPKYHPPMIAAPPTQRRLVAPPPPDYSGKKRSVLRTSSLSSQEESSGSDNEAHHSPKESLRGKKMVTFNYLATVKLV